MVGAADMAEGGDEQKASGRGLLEFTPATEEYERALALGPGNARVMRDYGLFAALMGREDLGLTSLRRAVVLDPLNIDSHLRALA